MPAAAVVPAKMPVASAAEMPVAAAMTTTMAAVAASMSTAMSAAFADRGARQQRSQCDDHNPDRRFVHGILLRQQILRQQTLRQHILRRYEDPGRRQKFRLRRIVG